RCPRYREGGPDQDGRNNARQSDIDEQIIQKPGLVGVEMTDMEGFVKKKEDHVPDWDRVLAQGKGNGRDAHDTRKENGKKELADPHSSSLCRHKTAHRRRLSYGRR